MAQEDDHGTEVNEALKVFRMIFIANDQATEVKQPSEQSLDLPPSTVSSQPSAILRAPASSPIRGNHFCAVLLPQLLVQSIAVIRFVTNQLVRHVGHDPCFQRGRY